MCCFCVCVVLDFCVLLCKNWIQKTPEQEVINIQNISGSKEDILSCNSDFVFVIAKPLNLKGVQDYSFLSEGEVKLVCICDMYW